MIWMYLTVLNLICALLLYDNLKLELELDRAQRKLKKIKRCTKCQL